MRDGFADHDGYTIALPPCANDHHPPLAQWPDYNLIVGSCPSCGHQVPTHYPWRVLRARQVLKERDQ